MLQLTIWRRPADLIRVSGIGSEYGQLLDASGIETVTQLAQRKPENVVNLLDRVNSEKHLTRQVPPLKTVSKWIAHAKEMVPAHAHAQSAPQSTAAFSPQFPMR